MRQVSLKFKKYVSNVNIIDNSNLEYRILNILIMSLAFFAILYIFVLGSMVFDIVERKSLEKEALALSSEVGELELTYLDLSSKVDLELSYSLGFKETKPKFATRQTLGLNFHPVNNILDNEI